MRLGGKEVAVPDTKKTTKERNVVLQRSLAEMLVHLVSTREEPVEVIVTDVESNTETNGTPDRVPTSDPALETKHVLAVDSELGNFGLIGRKSDEVLGDITLSSGLLEEPRLSRVGVGNRLGSGEGFGGDQE